jgi:hypothetical protein
LFLCALFLREAMMPDPQKVIVLEPGGQVWLEGALRREMISVELARWLTSSFDEIVSSDVRVLRVFLVRVAVVSVGLCKSVSGSWMYSRCVDGLTVRVLFICSRLADF